MAARTFVFSSFEPKEKETICLFTYRLWVNFEVFFVNHNQFTSTSMFWKGKRFMKRFSQNSV